MITNSSFKLKGSKTIKNRALGNFNPLNFSVQLKSDKKDHSSTLTRSNTNNANRPVQQGQRQRASSAYTVNSSIITIPTKNMTSFIANNRDQSQKQDIKWIGVYPNNKSSQMGYSQVFPKRKQKNADQSFANFMLRYGRYFKRQNQSKSMLQGFYSQNNQINTVSNAATVKLKPRLTWFDRKKSVSYSRQANVKPQVEVVWFKNNN